MTCKICDKFPVPTGRFKELSVSDKRHGTLFCCLECGQIIETIAEERGYRFVSVMETMFDYQYVLPYIKRINCRQCGIDIDIDINDVLHATPYSWPHLQSVWHECQVCGCGNHVWIDSDEWGLIIIWGAPGPDWSFIQKAKRPGLVAKNDNGVRLLVTCDGEYYDIAAR